ncbi:MAG TPA: HTTM domain-containing protein, partial [Methylomirabilota bacterium]|nr:HTTM domain-containing protein [Methylomirabilota bacterium]
QALLPTRQYWIPGDGRVTYEGQSFSWRLKADVRKGMGHLLVLQDPRIISRDATGRTLINWTEWNGDRVIHRKVTPGGINWSRLPEIVALVEPVTGERMIYNPFSATAGSLPAPAASRERVRQIWQELHGRPPAAIEPALSFPDVLELIATALRESGTAPLADRFASLAARTRQMEAGQLEPAESVETSRQSTILLSETRDHEVVIPLLRRLHPFALQGEGRYTVPFLIIEDPLLVRPSPGNEWRIDRSRWRYSAVTRVENLSRYSFLGGEPLIIHTGDVHSDLGRMFPQAYIYDSLDQPDEPPSIRWNSHKDLTRSKYMHTSVQAFYLQRYASRVADLWEAEYSRRPKVFALTAFSLNGRPHQYLVDPDVDLAGVEVKRFGRNEWILDLETPRIPPEALHRPLLTEGQ